MEAWRQVSAEESAGIAASAAVVYDVVSDYHEGHPAMLPPRYFTHFQVDEGGRGAGLGAVEQRRAATAG